MSRANRVIVVAVLACAVAAVLVAKSRKRETASDEPAAVAGGNLPRLVDLGAGKCAACKMMAPVLDELKKEFAGTFDVEFIDVWEDPDAGEKYGIRMIPTQIFYDGSGKELFRHEGFFGRDQILAKWKELGVAAGGSPRG